MKMMSCIFDDEEESFSSASSSSATSPSPLKETSQQPKKMNFKQRFMRRAHPKLDESNESSKKVQRSASAIFKSKVSKVILAKRKKAETSKLEPAPGNLNDFCLFSNKIHILDHDAHEPEEKSDPKSEAILNGVTFDNLGEIIKKMLSKSALVVKEWLSFE